MWATWECGGVDYLMHAIMWIFILIFLFTGLLVNTCFSADSVSSFRESASSESAGSSAPIGVAVAFAGAVAGAFALHAFAPSQSQ